MSFHFPGGDARTTIIGATGTGKSTCGTWLLGHQRFDKRPWVVLDFKQERLFDLVGFPPIQQISLTAKPPKKSGNLYLVSPRPGQDDLLETWLWRVWEKGNIGLYVDEAALMPDRDAWRAILQQGRSKRIPVIACSQRPVDVKRALFSEASYFCVYRLQDQRDYKTVQGFAPAAMALPLPAHHWRWYDVQHNQLLNMAPVPRPVIVADELRARLPVSFSPFSWLQSPGPARLKLT
ncbi:MAG TPA: hypothetical protein VGF36_01620 [Rhodopila sp.]|jgi:hypothetical protein